ncbi:MAG: AAA family ATPase [Deltaproteobacteria bacterium]|nr:AAA family ATPase [Deltaproteobacteria bacterium]
MDLGVGGRRLGARGLGRNGIHDTTACGKRAGQGWQHRRRPRGQRQTGRRQVVGPGQRRDRGRPLRRQQLLLLGRVPGVPRVGQGGAGHRQRGPERRGGRRHGPARRRLGTRERQRRPGLAAQRRHLRHVRAQPGAGRQPERPLFQPGQGRRAQLLRRRRDQHFGRRQLRRLAGQVQRRPRAAIRGHRRRHAARQLQPRHRAGQRQRLGGRPQPNRPERQRRRLAAKVRRHRRQAVARLGRHRHLGHRQRQRRPARRDGTGQRQLRGGRHRQHRQRGRHRRLVLARFGDGPRRHRQPEEARHGQQRRLLGHRAAGRRHLHRGRLDGEQRQQLQRLAAAPERGRRPHWRAEPQPRRRAGRPFARVQFTPDLMPSDIVGAQVLHDDGRGGRTFAFQRGPVFTHILLADEINRATPKTSTRVAPDSSRPSAPARAVVTALSAMPPRGSAVPSRLSRRTTTSRCAAASRACGPGCRRTPCGWIRRRGRCTSSAAAGPMAAMRRP